MLTTLRNSASKLVLKIMFGLLILSFGIWGVGDIFRSSGRTTSVIEVGQVAVTQAELQDEYRRQMMQIQAIYGQQIDAETARALGLVDRVVNDLVTRALFATYAGRTGMRVADEQVKQAIELDPTFRNELGVFDRGRFEAWLQRFGFSEAALVHRLRNDIARSQLTASLISGVQVPQVLASAIYQQHAEKRVAQTLRIAAATMPAPAEPDQAILETFLTEHAEQYQSPELRAVTLVRLAPDELAKEIHVSDEEIAASFESRKAEFDEPERRHLEQIVFPDEAAAKAAADKLAAGGDFAEIARAATGGATIDLGTVTKEALASSGLGELAPLADVAFSIPAGQVTAPTVTIVGWNLVRVLSVEPGREGTLAEHRDEVARDLAFEQAHDGIVSIANQLEDELAGGASLEEAAGRLDLPVMKIPALDATGKAADGSAIDTSTAEPGLAAAAFATEAGQQSPLTDSIDGGYYMLRVDSVTPAATRPLAEVRDQVIADWQQAQRTEAAAAQALALVERHKGGEDIAALAAELGQEIKTSAPLARDASDVVSGLSSQAVDELFALAPGDVSVVTEAGDQVIVHLAEIQKPTDAGDPTATAEVRETLRRSIATDVVSDFVAALQQDIPVTVEHDTIDRMF